MTAYPHQPYWVIRFDDPENGAYHRFGTTDTPHPAHGSVVSRGLQFTEARALQATLNGQAQRKRRLYDGRLKRGQFCKRDA